MISPQTLQALALLCVVKAWKGLWRRGAFFKSFGGSKSTKLLTKLIGRPFGFPPLKVFWGSVALKQRWAVCWGFRALSADQILLFAWKTACFLGILEKSATSISCFQWINNFYCTNGEIAISNYTDVEGLATKRHSPCWFWIKRSRAPAMATW